ncbi:MAG TPA: hypothetical protein VM689_06195 [Aliidongia sp.]|jgi:hypothetical protein|nr:hypothetical protein [Aliidongia sp.]
MDRRRDPPDGDDQDDGGSNRGPVIGLAVIVALALIGWFVMRGLQDKSKLEDCLMEGRHNCAPVQGQR